VALLIEVLVEGLFDGAGRVVWDNRDGAGCRNGGTEMVGIIGCISHDDGGLLAGEQRRGLRDIALLTGGEDDADRTSEATDRKVDFGT
jgi:hypothetical protein